MPGGGGREARQHGQRVTGTGRGEAGRQKGNDGPQEATYIAG